MNEGRVRRAYLGIVGSHRAVPPRLVSRTTRKAGVGITDVMAGSPAARAGVRVKDLILEVDGLPLDDAGDLQRLMIGDAIGRAHRVRILRDDQVIELLVTPAELEE
jgi:serine protease Do